MLGPFEVVRGGRQLLPPRAPKERTLLLRLLLAANQIVSSDSLIDCAWGERPPPTAAAALCNCISRIRKLIEPEACASGSRLLVTAPSGYVLHVESNQLDSARVERTLERSRQARECGDLNRARRLLSAVETVWRGEPLVDFSFEDFARGEIERLEELRLLFLAERIEVELALGRHQLVICELRRLVCEHPFHEQFLAQLMLALYRSGRQADALNVYRDARTALLKTLGISPSRALRLLEGDILRQEPFLDGPGARLQVGPSLSRGEFWRRSALAVGQ